jgi:uncharacterized protein with GYD domain
MQYYLVRLAYTAEAWQTLLGTRGDIDARLDNVRRLLKELGGSFADYGFFDDPNHVVKSKFVPFGAHDIVCIIATPNEGAARAFQMAVSAEVGVKSIELTPMMPYADAINAMDAAQRARTGTKYFAPGGRAP